MVTNEEVNQLDIEMSEILRRMGEYPKYEDAKSELDALAELHGLLATLLFRCSVNLTDRQRKVVRVFDRWDDEDTRRYFYGEVAAGRM